MPAPIVNNIKEYFDTLEQRFVADASKGVNAVFQFELAGDGGGQYHLVVEDGAMHVHEGGHDKPNATIKMSADDYVKMVNGKLNGQMAAMTGKLKVGGNILMARKMQKLFPPAGK